MQNELNNFLEEIWRAVSWINKVKGGFSFGELQNQYHNDELEKQIILKLVDSNFYAENELKQQIEQIFSAKDKEQAIAGSISLLRASHAMAQVIYKANS